MRYRSFICAKLYLDYLRGIELFNDMHTIYLSLGEILKYGGGSEALLISKLGR